MKSNLKPCVAIFLAVFAVYALVAWDRLPHPSPHFHFTDLAYSFLHGRLDTDTPKQRRGQRARDDDPAGYREAIARTYEAGGWNDWASLRTLTLKQPLDLDGDGEPETSVIKGRFPWEDERDGDRRYRFYTVDGYDIKVELDRDLKRGCGDRPAARCDQTTHYVSFPPFPAIALMPFVAIWGYDTLDTFIAIMVAALNAVLLFLLLQLLVERGYSRRSTRENVWLTLCFAFGSVAFFASVQGSVWFVALVYGVTLNLAYILAALDLKHPILAGVMLGLGMATRTPIAFCVVFFAWQLFLPGNRWRSDRWREILVKGTLFAVPIIAIGAALVAYNTARFESAFEFGHTYLTGGPAARIREHGLFSTWYLNLNLSAALTNVPRITSEAPYVLVTKHGLGLLFTTPVLLLLARPRARSTLSRVAWITVIFAAVPGLLYQNTGWEQFGYRFALDYFPYLMILLAIGGRPLTRWVKLAIAAGVLVNLFGAITFARKFGELQFYY